MIEIKFTCNICGETFISNDPKIKTPLGWGAVKPTLRVNMPSFPDKARERKKYWEFKEKCKDLKDELSIREYHICHKCLELGQDKILKIEQRKKRF